MGKLKILQWNIRSIKKNRPYLEQIIAIQQPDVIILQEARDNSGEGYIFNKYQEPVRTKNTVNSTYVSEKFTKTVLETTSCEDYESSTIEIENNTGEKFIITNLHRKFTSVKNFKTHLENLFEKYNDQNYIIAGDFNLHHPIWNDAFIDNRNYNEQLYRSDEIANLILDQEAIILNNGQYTRYDDHDRNASAIDLTILNKRLAGHNSDWVPLDDSSNHDRGNSDHIPLISIIGGTYTDQTTPPPTGYNYKKLDKNKLRKELKKTNWKEIREMHGDTLDKEINKILIGALEISIKKQKKSKNNAQKKVPWWNTKCQEAINNKKAASKALHRKPTTENLHNYREKRNECNRIIKEEKKNHWHNYVNSISLKTSDTETWKKIKSMGGGHTKSRNIPTLIDQDKKKHTTSKEKANILGETYSTLSSDKNYSRTFLETKNNYERINNCNLSDKEANNEENLNKPLTIEEFETALKNKKDTKEGMDQIRYTVYKELPIEGKETVLKLLNDYWEKGEIPQYFKHAVIVPVQKPDKNPTEPKNYRPISLTSHLGKLLETIINNRLMNYIETNGIFKNTQSGFRQKRQTMDHVVRMTSDIETCIKKNKINLAVCLDLQRAFDSIHRQGILLELKKMNVTGQMFNYIQCFLRDRTFQVKVDNNLSDIHTQDNGTPQGSVISPTLFNILMNSLPDIKANHPHVEIGTYADDIAIWLKPEICRSKKGKKGKKDTSKQAIEKAAKEIIKELENRGFIVNLAKTQTIMFNGKSRGELYNSLNINGEEIKFSDSIKYLGVILDKKLNFNEHINEQIIKAKKSMNILYKLSGYKDWGSDSNTLRTVYLSLIRSKLTYGEEVYHRARKSKLNELDKLQNRALRVIIGVGKRAGDENSLGILTNIEPLNIHRQISIANLSYRIRGNPSNPARDSLVPNTQITVKNTKNINEENQNILQAANITETILEHRPLREHWNNKIIETGTDPEPYETADNTIYVSSNKNTGKITYKNQKWKYKYNAGISEPSANIDLIDTALSLVLEGESIDNTITIVTDNVSTIKSITFKENTDRSDNLESIYRKKEIIENKGTSLKIRLGHTTTSISAEVVEKEIPLTYKEVKPIIKNKIIKNIWKKHLTENDKYQIITAIGKAKEINRQDRHLNHLRLGRFLTSYTTKTCPHCEVQFTIKHLLEDCTANEEERKNTEKQLKTYKIPLSAINLLRHYKNKNVNSIIKNYISIINNSFNI